MLGATSADDDALFERFIKGVSAAGEDYLARWTQTGRRTETYELRANRSVLILKGMPISSVLNVRFASTPVFTDVDPLTADSDFFLFAERAELRFSAALVALAYSPAYVQVEYVGGMAADTDEFVDVYPSIAEACDLEVINRYNRRKTPSGNLKAFDTQVAYEKPLEGLKLLKDALDPFRRIVL